MWRWLAGGGALVLAVVAVILGLGGTLDHTSRHDDGVLASSAHRKRVVSAHARTTVTHVYTTPRTPTLVAGGGLPSGRAAVTLHASLQRLLHMAGAVSGSGALVYDMTANRELFAADPTVARPPASVEKIWTTTALMDRLGPNLRLQTAILGTGHLVHGTWEGDLYLRGGGDPTFGDQEFNSIWNHGEGPTANQLVAQLRGRGIRRVSGRVYADESLFDDKRGGLITGQKPDIPDLGGQLSALTYDHGTTLAHYTPATFAAHEVVLTMRGFHIRATAARQSRRTPATAQLLARVSSPPMLDMTRLMDVPSDDFFAELFCKQLGVLFGDGGTIAAGAKVIAQTIASRYDLHPVIRDGSGLSRMDRTSPLEIVTLLRDLWHTRVGDELDASLPTTGVSGTVQTIGIKRPARGNCEAKTGSLDGVTNLAGWCRTTGGHELAFGIFIDGPPNDVGFDLESRMVESIAGY